MRKLIHKLLRGASLTTALFIFEACYGMPMDMQECVLDFKVVSSEDGLPLKGINVSINNTGEEGKWYLTGQTDAAGLLTVGWSYIDETPSPEFRFESPDGEYAVKDTSFTDLTSRMVNIALQKIK